MSAPSQTITTLADSLTRIEEKQAQVESKQVDTGQLLRNMDDSFAVIEQEMQALSNLLRPTSAQPEPQPQPLNYRVFPVPPHTCGACSYRRDRLHKRCKPHLKEFLENQAAAEAAAAAHAEE